MRGIEKKLLRLNGRIAELQREERLVEEELAFHRHIDDDAQRDAAVSGMPADVSEARATAADVARFERALRNLRRRRAELEERREGLLGRLGDL